MSRETVELVERLAAAFSAADFETALRGMDPEVVLHPRPDELGVDDVYHGQEGVFEWAINWYSQWDEYEAVPVKFVEAPGTGCSSSSHRYLSSRPAPEGGSQGRNGGPLFDEVGMR